MAAGQTPRFRPVGRPVNHPVSLPGIDGSDAAWKSRRPSVGRSGAWTESANSYLDECREAGTGPGAAVITTLRKAAAWSPRAAVANSPSRASRERPWWAERTGILALRP